MATQTNSAANGSRTKAAPTSGKRKTSARNDAEQSGKVGAKKSDEGTVKAKKDKTAKTVKPTGMAKDKTAKDSAIAKAKSLAPQLTARIGSTPRTKYRGNPDIFGRLVEDHDRHRALLAMVEESSPKSEERGLLFAELTKELKSHAAAEEQALWSTVMRNPATTDDARHAVSEHKEIDDMLADLAARDMKSAAWLRRFAALKDEYLHHIGEEEQEQFVAAEKQLSNADTRYMRKVFEQRKKAEKAAAKIKKKIKLKD